jgi:hypothetical protein
MYWIVMSYSLTHESINPLSPKTCRDTIIVNFIHICCALISLVRLLGCISSSNFSDIFDNDEVKQDLGFTTQYTWVPMVLAGIAILVLSLRIWDLGCQ